MSFILDALKKSEQTRNHQQGPAHSRYVVTPAQHKKNLWPLTLLLCCFVIGAIAMGWWLGRHSGNNPAANAATSNAAVPAPATEKPLRTVNTTTSSPPSETPAVVAAAPEKSAPVTRPDIISAPLPHYRKTTEQKPLAHAGQEEPAPAAPTTNVTNVSDLPQSLRQQLPQLRISMHFYTPDPARRLVRIDGSLRHEGEALTTDLTIAEIQEQSVLLLWRGRPLRLQHTH